MMGYIYIYSVPELFKEVNDTSIHIGMESSFCFGYVMTFIIAVLFTIKAINTGENLA